MSDEKQKRPDPTPAHSVQPGIVFGKLVLSVMTAEDVNKNRFRSTEFVLDWRAAAMLYSNMHSAMAGLNDDRLRAMAAGDCKTCGNLRLVMVQKNGRDWQERCPDCGPKLNREPAFPKSKEAS